MNDINIGKEVVIDSKEGEITNVLGVNWYEITFFNLNDGVTRFPKKRIEEYIVTS